LLIPSGGTIQFLLILLNERIYIESRVIVKTLIHILLMKRPFDTVRQMFLKNLSKTRENSRSNFEQLDKFMVWIVGFSIGGVSILATNLSQFTRAYNHDLVKIILILLSISIITGIIYRWSFYLFQVEYQAAEFYFESAFADEDFMQIDPDDLSEEKDYKEVVRRLKEDYGEDHSNLINIYENSDNDKRKFLLSDLIRHYHKVGEWAKKDFEIAVEYAKDTYQKAFGLSAKKIDKIFNSSSAFWLRVYSKVTSVAFLISCISFVAVLVLICVKY
jgi:hypothetical protein